MTLKFTDLPTECETERSSKYLISAVYVRAKGLATIWDPFFPPPSLIGTHTFNRLPVL